MSRVLINISSGPDELNRTATAVLAASAVAESGHELIVFLTEDGVDLVNGTANGHKNGHANAKRRNGVSGGKNGKAPRAKKSFLQEQCDAIVAAGGRFVVCDDKTRGRRLGPDGLPNGPLATIRHEQFFLLAEEADEVWFY